MFQEGEWGGGFKWGNINKHNQHDSLKFKSFIDVI